MTYYASKHGAGKANTIKAISDRKEFKSGGALSGSSWGRNTGQLSGDALETFYAESNDIDYVVSSYSTPIAWHTSKGWTMPEVKYSVTTTNHQALTRQGIRYYENDAYKSGE